MTRRQSYNRILKNVELCLNFMTTIQIITVQFLVWSLLKKRNIRKFKTKFILHDSLQDDFNGVLSAKFELKVFGEREWENVCVRERERERRERRESESWDYVWERAICRDQKSILEKKFLKLQN